MALLKADEMGFERYDAFAGEDPDAVWRYMSRWTKVLAVVALGCVVAVVVLL